MLTVPEDRCERYRLSARIDEAFRAGDFVQLGQALGGADKWYDEPMPSDLGLGHPLEYAIYWSPITFIDELINAGSNVNYPDDAGFPSLIAALSANRPDRLDVVALLIRHGADLGQRGVNDWTPLHWAASTGNLEAVRLLLTAGADPSIRTRIDNRTTALDEAEAAGFADVAALIRDRAGTSAREG